MLPLALALVAVLLVSITGAALAQDGTIDIEVSPKVLNIESNGGSLSINTNIGYVSAEDTTVAVNGEEVAVIATFLDNRGNLVVKCDIDEVKGIVTPGETAVFVLICKYNGAEYTGTDSVPVISVVPQKA
jgi:hypothetical protein